MDAPAELAAEARASQAIDRIGSRSSEAAISALVPGALVRRTAREAGMPQAPLMVFPVRVVYDTTSLEMPRFMLERRIGADGVVDFTVVTHRLTSQSDTREAEVLAVRAFARVADPRPNFGASSRSEIVVIDTNRAPLGMTVAAMRQVGIEAGRLAQPAERQVDDVRFVSSRVVLHGDKGHYPGEVKESASLAEFFLPQQLKYSRAGHRKMLSAHDMAVQMAWRFFGGDLPSVPDPHA
jgi:hypothetical protein